MVLTLFVEFFGDTFFDVRYRGIDGLPSLSDISESSSTSSIVDEKKDGAERMKAKGKDTKLQEHKARQRRCQLQVVHQWLHHCCGSTYLLSINAFQIIALHSLLLLRYSQSIFVPRIWFFISGARVQEVFKPSTTFEFRLEYSVSAYRISFSSRTIASQSAI